MPPKEAASGYVEPPVGSEMIDLHIVCLNGEGCKLSLHPSTLGQEVCQLVSKHLSTKKGTAPCFTAGARPKFARSGHCRGCDPFFYLCSNRFLCCMVLRPGISGTGGRARIGGSDTNGRDNTRRVRAPPPAKSEPLDLWKEVQWEPGRSHFAQQFAELNLRTWF